LREKTLPLPFPLTLERAEALVAKYGLTGRFRWAKTACGSAKCKACGGKRRVHGPYLYCGNQSVRGEEGQREIELAREMVAEQRARDTIASIERARAQRAQKAASAGVNARRSRGGAGGVTPTIKSQRKAV
jgi:hypothetical protein